MSTPGPSKAPGILIVDDMPANVLLLVRMLAERGYRTQPVPGGRRALAAARAEPPDLILLDINMPDMNGYEVCEQFKADPSLRDIPVIFISALNETIDKVRAFRVGGVDYVTKPFQFDEVYARVQTHLHLRRLEKLRDDLTHMFVHDLRSPLSVISMFLDVLEADGARHLSAATLKYMAIARLSTEELRDMIGSILDVSKLDAGEMNLQCVPHDLVALARTMVAGIQTLPGNRKVTLDAPEPSLMVAADIGLMRRVLQNLFSNALRYTPSGGSVRLAVTPSPGEVRFTVTDDGPGIAPEHHQRIFEKFGQVGDENCRTGTGLGLTFCKLAVEAHGGRIGVDSEVGRGSTFWLALPRKADVPALPHAGAAAAITATPAESPQRSFSHG